MRQRLSRQLAIEDNSIETRYILEERGRCAIEGMSVNLFLSLIIVQWPHPDNSAELEDKEHSMG